MLQKWRTYQHIVIWVALTLVLTSLDWPFGLLSSFWQRYSFMTGVVTGLLLLGFGLFAVEAWFKEREARRWRYVAYIAAKELGFITDNLLRGMDYVLCGRRLDVDGMNLESHLHERLIACLDRHGIALHRHLETEPGFSGCTQYPFAALCVSVRTPFLAALCEREASRPAGDNLYEL